MQEEEDVDPTAGLEKTSMVVGSLLGGSVTLSTAAGAVPGWLGTLAAALASPAVAIAAQVTLNKQSKQIQDAVDAACEDGVHTFDDIIAASVTSTRKTEMLATMLQGAARSEDDRHVRALGRLLVEGVFAPPGPDAEYARIMTALAQLDATDLELMGFMARESDKNKAGALNLGFVLRPTVAGNTIIAERLPHLEPVLDSLAAKLTNLGIVVGSTEGGSYAVPIAYRVTAFGQLCAGRLLAEGTAEEQAGH